MNAATVILEYLRQQSPNWQECVSGTGSPSFYFTAGGNLGKLKKSCESRRDCFHYICIPQQWCGPVWKKKTCVCVYLYPSNLGLTVSSAVVETVTLWRMVSDTETCYYRKSIKNDILVRRWCQRSNANYCIIQAKRRILYQDFTNMSAKINTNVAYTLQIVGRGPLAGRPRGSLSWVYDFVLLWWLPQ